MLYFYFTSSNEVFIIRSVFGDMRLLAELLVQTNREEEKFGEVAELGLMHLT